MMRHEVRRSRRAVTVRFGGLRPGQQFRIMGADGAPVMAVLYTRIPDTIHRGSVHNAMGWGVHPDGREGRRYCRFAPSAIVLLDTFNVLEEAADEEVEILPGVDAFDPGSTPGPPPGTFAPDLDDLW